MRGAAIALGALVLSGCFEFDGLSAADLAGADASPDGMQVFTQGLVARWSFDEQMGTIAADSSAVRNLAPGAISNVVPPRSRTSPTRPLPSRSRLTSLAPPPASRSCFR